MNKMDIQKERESFESWHYNQYLLENPNIDISNAKYIYDYAHKNVLVCQLRESHFLAWQAAKAQAVQDGFVAVSKTPSLKVLDRLFAEHDIDEERAVHIYRDIIEAQDE